jgi:hypothetical protein
LALLTVETDTIEVALDVQSALSQFEPVLTAAGAQEYYVTVVLEDDGERIIDAIDVLERRFAEVERGPAFFDLDSRSYVLHAPQPLARPARGQ